MKEKVEKFSTDYNKKRNKLVRELKSWVTDESIPLDERWDLFVKYGEELGDNGGYIEEYDSLQAIRGNEEDEFDNFEEYYLSVSTERYIKITISNILFWLQEEALNSSSRFTITDEEINSFKREALQKFVYEFIYDW